MVDHAVQICLCGRDLYFNRAEGVKTKNAFLWFLEINFKLRRVLESENEEQP